MRRSGPEDLLSPNRSAPITRKEVIQCCPSPPGCQGGYRKNVPSRRLRTTVVALRSCLSGGYDPEPAGARAWTAVKAMVCVHHPESAQWARNRSMR